MPETATDEMIEAPWDSDAADYVGEHKRIHCLADAWKEMLAVAPAAQTADHSEDILDMVRSEKRARALSDLAAADGDLLAAGVDRLPTPQPADHRRVQDTAPARPELDALIAEAKAQAPQPGGAPGYKIGAANRAAVRALLASHLGITRVEIAERLGLSPMAVTRHVAKIRAEWGALPLATGRNRRPIQSGEG